MNLPTWKADMEQRTDTIPRTSFSNERDPHLSKIRVNYDYLQYCHEMPRVYTKESGPHSDQGMARKYRVKLIPKVILER